MKIYIVTILSFFTQLVWSETPSLDEQKINFLLDRVEKSEAVFIRNGSEHTCQKARLHLEHKVKMAKRRFLFFGPKRNISVEDFIEKIASASSTTGEIYRIRLKTGETVPTGEWLKKTLKEFTPDTPKDP